MRRDADRRSDPDGADAVVMVEYTAETMPGTIEVTRPVAPAAASYAPTKTWWRAASWRPPVGRSGLPTWGFSPPQG